MIIWPQWRGPGRDGRVPSLPRTLGKSPNIQWELPLAQAGLGGIAATTDYVVFGDRDLDDFHDVFRCLNAQTGDLVWEIQRLAIAALDYGNSPRATPLIDGDRAFLASAHGLVLCVQLSDGAVIWEKNLREEFEPAGELPWGYCASPLLIDGKLIVNPGAADASLIAVDAATGNLLWKSPGAAAGYGSFAVGSFKGHRQIVGHDAVSLGGWDVGSGKRLWTVKPSATGDFNVPTPLVINNRLLVVTENNGARLFDFDDDGNVIAEPVAINSKLRPDMSTPVVINGHVFCVNRFLYCLDATNGLNELWRMRDASFGDYAAMFVSPERILIVGNGELLLVPTNGQKQVLSRLRVFEEKLPIYSHAALVGRQMYIRGETRLVCLKL